MKNKSSDDMLNQLSGRSETEQEGVIEITPNEAEELVGGITGDRQSGCPIINKGCSLSPT